jgi:hypothetical protein
MFNKTTMQEYSRTLSWTHKAAGIDNKRSKRFETGPVLAWVAIMALTAVGQASGETVTKADFTFINAVDNTQGFSSFGSMPAINNAGAVAFPSLGAGFESGAVLRWQYGAVTTIASSADKVLTSFGDSVAINSFGTVGFSAKVPGRSDTIIATGDGGTLNTIASANEQGIVGGQFLGISAMNESGTVIFLAFRKGFRSQAIFSGRGGPLTAIVDTAADPNFLQLGNADINASGNIVFHGFPADGTEGIFSNARGIKVIADTNTRGFGGFLDPVINNAGTAATSAFLNSGGVEVFTGTAAGITPRTNPGTPFLTFVDNVSINNSADVAFFATEGDGRAGIFIELTGGSNAIPVIETGDPLFGSTVIAMSVGRFCLNDRGQIALRYQLLDGRAGIAVASRRH